MSVKKYMVAKDYIYAHLDKRNFLDFFVYHLKNVKTKKFETPLSTVEFNWKNDGIFYVDFNFLKNVENIPTLKLNEKTLLQFLDNYLRVEVYCLIKFTDRILETAEKLKYVLDLLSNIALPVYEVIQVKVWESGNVYEYPDYEGDAVNFSDCRYNGITCILEYTPQLFALLESLKEEGLIEYGFKYASLAGRFHKDGDRYLYRKLIEYDWRYIDTWQ